MLVASKTSTIRDENVWWCFDVSDIALLNRIILSGGAATSAAMKLICGNGLHRRRTAQEDFSSIDAR